MGGSWESGGSSPKYIHGRIKVHSWEDRGRILPNYDVKKSLFFIILLYYMYNKYNKKYFYYLIKVVIYILSLPFTRL